MNVASVRASVQKSPDATDAQRAEGQLCRPPQEGRASVRPRGLRGKVMQGARLDNVCGIVTVLGVHRFSSGGPARSSRLRSPKPGAKERISSRTSFADRYNTHNITPSQTR
jgi:hypothetical protein